MTNNHMKTKHPSNADLKRDPGIGQSKDLNRAEGDEDISGQNTEEGDIANDVNRFGGGDPNQRGRANKWQEVGK